MHRAGGRFDHDRFVCAQVVDRKHAAGLHLQVIGKAAVERQAVGAQVFAKQAVPAFAVKAGSADGVAVRNDPLADAKPGGFLKPYFSSKSVR